MLIFFEIDKINVERFYFSRLEENFDTENVVVVLEDPNELTIFKKEYPTIKSYQFLDWIRGASKQYKNSYVFVNGNRIPDLLMAKIGRENDCKVIFIQHGMYVDFMKREVSLFIRKLKKALRYVSYAIRLKKVISLFKVHVFGHSRGLTSDRKELYPHSAFVYSEYWKRWHNETFFFDNTKSYYLLKNNDTDQNVISLDNSVVYCYQTLIEDGRIDVSYFKKVIHEIIRSVEVAGLNLVVKGHPRMSESTKDFFEEQGVEVLLSGLPSGGIIIGHYSTLLARWVYEGDVLLLVELEDHVIPEPIRNLATSVCQITEFSRVLTQNVKRDVYELKELSDYYFNFSGSDSVYNISEILKVCES
jgi:hypothetical protein